MTREEKEHRDNMESLLSQYAADEAMDLQPLVDSLNLIARVLYLGLDALVANQARSMRNEIGPAFDNIDPSPGMLKALGLVK